MSTLTPDEKRRVNAYIAARKRGDADGASRIARDAASRFSTRTTSGAEAAAIYDASMTVPMGGAR